MASRIPGMVVRYIQNSISDGRELVDDYYVFSRKELIEGAEISASSFNPKIIGEIITILRDFFDFNSNFNIKKFKWHEQNLFVDISYDKGILKFKRNPLSLLPEYSYMWNEIRISEPYFHYIFSNTYNEKE